MSQIRFLGGHAENTDGVCMAQSSLPALNGNDGVSGLDDLQVQSSLETKADTVVDLYRSG